MWIFHAILGLLVLGGMDSPPWSTQAYNIESRHYTTYLGQRSSMFGFSVASFRDRSKRGWVIVGAPQAQTNVKNVYRGGAVYRCNVAIDSDCTQITFDNQEHNQIKRKTPPYDLMQIDNKTMQWFGATVATSAQDGGPILACAPRYVFFGVAPGKSVVTHRDELAFGNQRDPVGTCFLTYMETAPREFSPCRSKSYGYHKQGSCQAGFAAAVSKDGERIFVGAPGSWYWQGQMYSIPRRSPEFPFVPPQFKPYGEFAGQTYTQRSDNQGKVFFTKEAASSEDDRYLGYAVISGDFVGKGESGTAVGVPRGSNLHGMVILLSWNMTEIQNITGAQMGSYFGYALAAGDIDNDGLDDLIVGAPMYTVPDNPQMHFETGKVYIYYGKGPKKYSVYDERSGESNQGRFGLSLAYLGDIDHDGYGDFAVGAPYAGPGGRGAVYIYQGSQDGLLEKYSQVIYGEELSSRVETFGFSIAGGLDLDGNLYPDMVVGSYESDSAMFFRSRPVIKMVPLETYVQFNSSDKLVSLDDRECVLSDGTRVTCLRLKSCFKYTGEGLLPRYNFNVQYALDTKNTKSPRMCFLELEGRYTMNVTIEANRNEQYCRTVKVYITPNIRDKLTSLDAEMRMSLDHVLEVDNRPRNPLLVLRPILARTSSRKDSISIRKNCGPDNICTPDLQLNCTSSVIEYLMGSNEKIILTVKVVNAFEDAFEAMFNLKIPPGIDYIKIERIDKAEIPVQCSPVKQGFNLTLKCDIGNPLPKDNLVHFRVVLQPTTVHHEMSSYKFEMETNSSNPEHFSTTHDNLKNLSIKIWVKTDLLIEGDSKPKDIYYNPENYTSTNVTSESEYGPGFMHNYTIFNGGPVTIEEAEVFLVWPAATLAGDDLVYLLEQPETSGPIVCASANSNPLSLKLERKNRIWLNGYSGVTGVTGSSGTIVSGGGSSVTGSGVQTNEGSARYPPIPPYNDSDVRLTGSGTSGTMSGSSGSGSFSSGGYGSSGSSQGSNSSHKVTYGPNGEVIIVEDEWKQTGGIITTVNVTTSVTENSYKESRRQDEEIRTESERRRLEEESFSRRRQEEENERRRQEEEAIARRQEEEAKERRRQEEEAYSRRREEELTRRRQQEQQENIRREQEEYARRRQQEIERRQQEHQSRGHEVVYGTEKQSGGSSDSWSHGVVLGRPVLTPAVHTDQAISGDREENFGFRLSNVSSSQDLVNFLGSLTRDSVGYEVFTEGGQQYLSFLGRYRVSSGGEEFIEFKDGTTFPLETKSGAPSVSSQAGRADLDRSFKRLEGRIETGADGRGYIMLRDGRRFALKGTYTYSEERTYTSSGGHQGGSFSSVSSGGHQGGSFSSVSPGGQGTTLDEDEEEDYEDDYGSSWREEESNRGRDEANSEFESHSTKTHEEKRTFERKQGSRVYARGEGSRDSRHAEDLHEPSGAQRAARHRREDDAMTVDEFRRLQKSHKKNKRQTEQAYDDFGGLGEARIKEKSVVPMCKAARCVSLRCTVGSLEKDQQVWISARYRVNAATLRKVAAQEELKVSTQLISQVTKLPTVGKPEKDVVKSHEIYTSLHPQAPAPAPDVIPLWVVVLSACAGVIILLLLIYILHKCGFFKRNRPTDAPERQPLNRNGHFHGDDHL